MSATVRICTCVAAYVPAVSVFFAVGVSVCAFISVHKCVPCISTAQLGEQMRRCPTCAWHCVYSHICVSVCVERMLSGAAPCCASRIWSHLRRGTVGGERMTLMYLNSRQTFLRHSSVWNQDNWAQSSWTAWSGLVSRRQTLWLHSNSWSDSPGSLRQTDTHKHWNLFVSMIETQCFISKGILSFS